MTTLQVIKNQEQVCMDLIASAHEKYPERRFARNADYSCIASWHEETGRWYRVAALALDGKWYATEMDILVNGQPLVTEWIEA